MIVDRIFQPLADRLAGHLSPFDLARHGVAVMVVCFVSNLIMGDWPGWMIAVVASALSIFIASLLADIRAAERAPMGTMNPIRAGRVFVRGAAFVLCVLGVLVRLLGLALDLPLPDLLRLVFAHGYDVGWVVAEFFAACERRPPKRQEQSVPAWVTPAVARGQV